MKKLIKSFSDKVDYSKSTQALSICRSLVNARTDVFNGNNAGRQIKNRTVKILTEAGVRSTVEIVEQEDAETIDHRIVMCCHMVWKGWNMIFVHEYEDFAVALDRIYLVFQLYAFLLK